MWMRCAWALLLALVFVGPVQAQSSVVEDANFFHIFWIAANRDSTLKIADFDIDGDGDIDCTKIIKIGWSTGAATDSLSIHLKTGWLTTALPLQKDVVVPIEGKNFRNILRHPHSGAPSPADSVVIRYDNNTGAVRPLFVWGQ